MTEIKLERLQGKLSLVEVSQTFSHLLVSLPVGWVYNFSFLVSQEFPFMNSLSWLFKKNYYVVFSQRVYEGENAAEIPRAGCS